MSPSRKNTMACSLSRSGKDEFLRMALGCRGRPSNSVNKAPSAASRWLVFIVISCVRTFFWPRLRDQHHQPVLPPLGSTGDVEFLLELGLRYQQENGNCGQPPS